MSSETSVEPVFDGLVVEVLSEIGLVGAALIDERAARTLVEVPLDDFLDQRLRVIAGAIRDVVGELARPDVILVLDRLHTIGHHEITLADLHRLFVETPSITSAPRYAAIIRRRARHRRTVHVAADLSAAALRGDDAEIRRLTAQLVDLVGEEEPDQ